VTTGKVLKAVEGAGIAPGKNNLRGRNARDLGGQAGILVAEIASDGRLVLGGDRVYRSGMGRDAVWPILKPQA